jgi:hypothetical protein
LGFSKDSSWRGLTAAGLSRTFTWFPFHRGLRSGWGCDTKTGGKDSPFFEFRRHVGGNILWRCNDFINMRDSEKTDAGR